VSTYGTNTYGDNGYGGPAVWSEALQAQQGFNNHEKWAAAPAPPWELIRYTIDLASLARPAMLSLGRF
jgi:hypothetical protein